MPLDMIDQCVALNPVRRLRKNCTTRGSEFNAAKASRSASRHCRRQMRPLDNVGTLFIARKSLREGATSASRHEPPFTPGRRRA
jgi:hypothetical protein